MPSHLQNMGQAIPDEVVKYFSENQHETLQNIYKIPRSASLYINKGTLLRVHLENFLTHRDRIVDFQRPITLIHGQNGSGKSSILQAVHYLINGKPSKVRDGAITATDLKTQVLIKNTTDIGHSNSCKVTGWFWTGQQVIGVQRSHVSANQFKVNYYNNNDRFINITVYDAVSIFQNMNHFPDNTSTMISQSLMKKLAQLDSSQRYQTFQEATNLDIIETSVNQTCQNIKEMENQIIELEDSVTSIQEEAQKIQKIIQENEKFSKIVIEGAGLQLEILSGECEELNLKCVEKQINLTEYQKNNIIPAQIQIYEYEKQLTRCGLETEQIEKQIIQQKEQVDQEQNILDNIQQDLSAEKLKFSREQIEQVRLENDKKQQVQNLDSTIKNIEKVKQRLKIFVLAPFLHREPEIPEKLGIFNQESAKLKEEENDIKTQIHEQKVEHLKIKQQIQNLNNKFNEFNQQLEQKQQVLRSLQFQLENMKSNQNIQNQIVKTLSSLDQDVYNKTKDMDGVYGPISAYMYVNEKFNKIQKQIQNYLTKRDIGQIVISNPDQESQVHNMVKGLYSTVTVKKAYTGVQLPSEINGIKIIPLLSTLVFSNDYVKTALLMTKNIENVIIIQNMKDAIKVFEFNPRLSILPIDAQAILTFTHNSVNSRPLSTQLYFNSSAESTIFIQENRSEKQILQGIVAAQNDITEFQQQETKFNQLDMEIIQKTSSLNKVSDQISNLDRKLAAINEQLNQAEKHRLKYLTHYNDQLQNFNRLKRENDDRIIEKQQLEDQVINSNVKIENYRTLIPELDKNINSQLQLTSKASLNFQAMKKIFDQQNEKLKLEQTELTSLQNSLEAFDKVQLLLNLSNLQQKLSHATDVYNEFQKDIILDQQQYQKFSEEIEVKSLNLLNSSRVIKAKNTKITPLSAAFFSISNPQDQVEIDSFRNKIRVQSKVALEALHLLQSQMEQFDVNKADISKEVEKLNQLVFNYQLLNDELTLIQQQKGFLNNSVCFGQLRLFSLRSRIEREIVAIFSKQSRELGISLVLNFQFGKLMHLDTVSDGWRRDVEPEMCQQYDEFYVENELLDGRLEIKSDKRDVKTLSGGEQTFAALCFITSLCKIVQSSYLQIDEWDVFMDAGRREKSFKMLSSVLLGSSIQSVLVTPNDVELGNVDGEIREIIGVVRLDSVVRM
ncbi:Chromosome segregation ATPase [Spironucleus salmonicida]|uniref:Chromosome segregation ATPase n=1 Tax=Spironucleus salmonicida TaxID=348837 RepID=V6LPY1_9EUKA|nr:Chromosome segregation ATPase [Spironucleus salmonicida]|eukprot:EST42814.1 RefF/RecN/SMC N terminal domain-containing protein [Spironucleus salmonicida]